jgi:CRP/FNR family transcriptional regulator, cyclic AMP receptor protein
MTNVPGRRDLGHAVSDGARIGRYAHVVTGTAQAAGEEAWSRCVFATLPQHAQQELRATGHELEILRGQVIFRELVQPRYSFLGLVISGVVRTFVTSPGGRRLATRYASTGDVVGLTTVLLDGAAGGLDCLRSGVLLRLDPLTLRRLGQADAAVAWTLAVQMAREISLGGARVPNMFGSVRVRVAWHLAQLMLPTEGGGAVVHLTQQELAESVGSVREVVARVLAHLREEGVLSRDARSIAVSDPDRLREIAENIDA